MRINIQGLNMNLPAGLERHAETRLWLASHRSDRRPGWIELLLERDEALRCVKFRADAWVRGIGLVSARGSAAGPFRAVDLAAHRLAQAIAGRAAPLRAPEHQLPSADVATTSYSDESVFRHPSPSGIAERDRPLGGSSHRFLDYDPVGIPHE
jgi:ribosome-associated translation inhibitor RaiA